MHRVIDITVPSNRGEQLIAALNQLEGVVGLTWQHGASIKPVGDVVTVHALNRATDDVMRAVATIGGDTPFTVVTAEVASITKTGSAGSGNAGNMQPFAVINFIICTGKTS